MRIQTLLSAIAIILFVPIANASVDYIGVFADTNAELCSLDLPPGETGTVRVFAIIPNLGEFGITAAEFAISGLPPSGYEHGGIWEAFWNTDLVLGDPVSGIALAFSNPQMGEIFELGYIEFTPFEENWLGQNRLLNIVDPPGSGVLGLVDHLFDLHLIPGKYCTLNCTFPMACQCAIPGCDLVPFELIWDPLQPEAFMDKTFSIQNNSDITLSGFLESLADEFQIIEGAEDYSIPPGESHAVTVRFTPPTEGLFYGLIETGCDECPDLFCSGEGLIFCPIFPEAHVELGQVAIGDHQATDFTITNPADSGRNILLDIQEDSEHLTLFDADEFVVLAPGEYHSFQAIFHPMVEGPLDCIINLGDIDCSLIIVSGTGVFDPSSHVATDHMGLFKFPNAAACSSDLEIYGQTEMRVIAIVSELGDESLVSADFRIANLPPSDWDLGGLIYIDWPEGVSPVSGDLWSGLKVQFQEPVFGPFIEILVLTFAALEADWIPQDPPLTVTSTLEGGLLGVENSSGQYHDLSGTAFHFNCASDPCECGDYSVPVPTVWPLTIDYGVVEVGETSSEIISVVNAGGGGLVEGQLIESGEAYHFQNGTEPFALAAGESLNAELIFAPPASGYYGCQVLTGVSEYPSVLCSGIADSPALCEVDPMEIDFGDTFLGEPANMELRIRNTGGMILSGYVGLDADPAFSIISGGGLYELERGETRVVDLRFDALEHGEYNGLVTLGSEDCMEAVPLYGRARENVVFPDLIGLFADLEGSICDLNLIPGETDTLFLIAKVPAFQNVGVLGFSFALQNLPESSGEGNWHFEWFADQVTGDPMTGVQVSYDEPVLEGEIVLAHLIIETVDPDWVGEDHLMEVTAAEGEPWPYVIDSGEIHFPMIGLDFTVNCTHPEGCPCAESSMPHCDLSTDFIDFGNVAIFEERIRYFHIENSGFGYLEGNISINGEGFSLLQGEGPFELGPGETVTGRIRFSPPDFNNYYGEVLTGIEECPSVALEGRGYGFDFGENLIGCFADPYGVMCYGDIEPYVPVTLHVLAYLAEYDFLTAAEFRIDNLPENLGYPYGTVTAAWATDLVIGDPWSGVSLAFPEPQAQGWILLGTLEFLLFDTNWIGNDYIFEVAGAHDYPQPVIVDGDWNIHYVAGFQYTFNCTEYEWYCDCWGGSQPVVISGFEIESGPGRVDLSWEAEVSEGIEFKLEAEEGSSSWILDFSESSAGSYMASDRSEELLNGGSILYRLFARETDEAWQVLEEERVEVDPAVVKTELLPPYPNPFNPSIILPFTLRSEGPARLSIVDVAGRRIKLLFEGSMDAGFHEWGWNGRDHMGRKASSGIYFAELETQNGSHTRKLVLIR